MTELDFITQQIKDEIRVDLTGKGKASISGSSRLCGVAQQSLSNAYNNPKSKLFQILVERGFDPYSFSEEGVPDVAVALTVSYYANKAGKRCTKEAQLVNDVLLSIGVRSWMQQLTGWQSPANRRLTQDEIAEICLLPSGRGWNKQFEDGFYYELSRLTGLEQFGSARPALWGALTDEWVYKLLPIGVREGVRRSREKHGNWHKLHQFLSDDGIEIFKRHMQTLMIVMKASETVNGVRRGLKNLAASEYQYRLFNDCRRDGKLTISKQVEQLSLKPVDDELTA